MPAIAQDVIRVLEATVIDGRALHLNGTLDRKLYERTAKIIEAAGGKWNRKAKAHLFEADAADAIEPILLTGEVTLANQELGQFDTPPELAERVVAAADIKLGMKILEPSCGIGNLIEAILKVTGVGACIFGVEIDQKRTVACKEIYERFIDGGSISCANFFNIDPNPSFDRVVMNPPFARQHDIDHVLQAAQFLAPGGRLVAIMSASVMFRENRRTADFRDFVDARGGRIEPLPAGSFRSSGTDVNTCLVAFGARFASAS